MHQYSQQQTKHNCRVQKVFVRKSLQLTGCAGWSLLCWGYCRQIFGMFGGHKLFWTKKLNPCTMGKRKVATSFIFTKKGFWSCLLWQGQQPGRWYALAINGRFLWFFAPIRMFWVNQRPNQLWTKRILSSWISLRPRTWVILCLELVKSVVVVVVPIILLVFLLLEGKRCPFWLLLFHVF